MMRHGLPNRPTRFRGPDVDVFEYLHAVGVDDLSTHPFCQRQRERRFTHRGRPADDENAWKM
jgi:hypothetical protein